jgi:predicted transcriptional regulator
VIIAKVTTVRLEEELSERVEALADAMDRSKAWIIAQAITSYVNEQSWQVAVIKEALADYRSGDQKLV